LDLASVKPTHVDIDGGDETVCHAGTAQSPGCSPRTLQDYGFHSPPGWRVAIIMADGSVGEITVLKSASPILEQSAKDALKQWRFTPGHQDVIMTLTVNFVLK